MFESLLWFVLITLLSVTLIILSLSVSRLLNLLLRLLAFLLLLKPQCLAFIITSRRLHTRSKRDWSSDVCSSDLGVEAETWSTSCASWCESSVKKRAYV